MLVSVNYQIGILGAIGVVMNKVTVVCPCCESTLIIDAATGAIVSHEAKGKKLSSFEDLQTEMKKQKEKASQLFAQEQETQKDRKRILDEKFKEAFKNADKSTDKPFKNPLDID